MQRHLSQALFAALFIALAPQGWGAGMIFKCKNANGELIYQKSACNGSAETVDSWKPEQKAIPPREEPADGQEPEKQAKKESSIVLRLKQGPGGHYATEGSINDKSLNFVVDTGASYVALPEETAHSALIYCDDKVKVDTANGIVDSCTTKIAKLQFGPFEIKDVIAVIQPNLGQPLLGMNVLQLFKIEQNNGEMHISVLEKPKSETN